MCTPRSGWLVRHKDHISAVSGIVSMLALCFAAYQFYLARDLLRTQASARALENGRSVLARMNDNADVASTLIGISEDDFKEKIFINTIISLYAEQHLLSQDGIIIQAHWDIMKRELCNFIGIPKVRDYVDYQLAKNSYPVEFAAVLKDCGGRNETSYRDCFDSPVAFYT